ncbi:MAG: DUF1403 family protein [Roseinatronobacter sp.]
MTHAHLPDPNLEIRPLRLPGWLARRPLETLEEGAFASGAALALLERAQANGAAPQALWRARLALGAAAQSVRLSGRSEPEAALRDIICLLRPGEQPGPAGAIAQAWRLAATRPLSDANLQRALPELSAQQIGVWDGGGHGGPVAQAAQVIEAVLSDAPRAHLAALILGDAVLARSFGWTHLVPLLGSNLPRRELKLRGDALRLACHTALVKSVRDALALATDLTRRAVRLHSVAPKLRSKQAATAVEMFLTRDAIAPAALVPLMSDRAARRLCDRLVGLGAVRELTGRDTFRLYGL